MRYMKGECGVVKTNLKFGNIYRHKRKTLIDGVPREAERFMVCSEITPDGAWFTRFFEEPIFLSNKEIKEELYV